MKSERFYSVIVPLYNKGAYVHKTLESLLAQSYQHFEVVLVDDGSTDDSAEVVRSFQDDRIRLIQQENQGVSAARNRGFEAARHEMIALIDADDYWDQEFLSCVDQLVDKYPDNSLFCARFSRIKGGEEVPCFEFFDDGLPDISFDLIDLLLNSGTWDFPINSSNTVFKKSLLEKSGCYDPRIRYCEDLDLLLRMAFYSRVAYYKERPLSFYYKDSAVDEKARGGVPPLSGHMLHYLDKFEELRRENELLASYLDRFVLDQLLLYVEDGTPRDAIENLLEKVDKGKYTWKHKWYFSFSPIGMFLVQLNMVRRKVQRFVQAGLRRIIKRA